MEHSCFNKTSETKTFVIAFCLHPYIDFKSTQFDAFKVIAVAEVSNCDGSSYNTLCNRIGLCNWRFSHHSKEKSISVQSIAAAAD